MTRPDPTPIENTLSGLADKVVGTVQEQAGKLLDDPALEARGAQKVEAGEAKLHGAPKAPAATTPKRARNGKTRRASRR